MRRTDVFAPFPRSCRQATSPARFCRPYMFSGSGSASTSYGGLLSQHRASQEHRASRFAVEDVICRDKDHSETVLSGESR